MAVVVETNISFDGSGEIYDHQTRVIKVDSWEAYLEEIENKVSVNRFCEIGVVHGYSASSRWEMKNFQSNNEKMSCDFYNSLGVRTKRIASLLSATDVTIKKEMLT